MNEKIMVVIFAYNEGTKIKRTLSKFPRKRNYDLFVMNDGSTDETVRFVEEFDNVNIISHRSNRGIGAAMKTVNSYALANNYDIVVHVAGNDKDNPDEIPRLINPILEEGYDYVQGSRYIPGGKYGNMPFYRLISTKYLHPFLFSLLCRRRIFDSTNGFRAFRTTLLMDKRINLNQDWLDKYELEPYFFYKAISLGYKVKEVSVTKIYPPKELGYTKMKPITGWWSILRPVIFLLSGIKK